MKRPEGLDAAGPRLREWIAAYLDKAPDAAESQRLLVATYYEGLAEGVLRERLGVHRLVEQMAVTRAAAYAALELEHRSGLATAQHAAAAEVLFTLLESLESWPVSRAALPPESGDA